MFWIVYIVIITRKSYYYSNLKLGMCLPHIIVFIYIFAVYISFECVCVCNYWEFCFINLRIINYFVGFGNYTLATQ